MLPAPRLGPTSTVGQALQFLVRGRRGAIVVVDGLKPVGIFTERDVLNRVGDGHAPMRDDSRRMLVRKVMSSPVTTIRRQDSLADAVRRMVTEECRHLVVVDRDGGLKGLLISNDIVQFVTERFPEDTVNLPPRLHQVYLRPEGA